MYRISWKIACCLLNRNGYSWVEANTPNMTDPSGRQQDCSQGDCGLPMPGVKSVNTLNGRIALKAEEYVQSIWNGVPLEVAPAGVAAPLPPSGNANTAGIARVVVYEHTFAAIDVAYPASISPSAVGRFFNGELAAIFNPTGQHLVWFAASGQPLPEEQRQPDPAPAPTDVLVDPRPNDKCPEDEDKCDTKEFANWWNSLPPHQVVINQDYAYWENSIARNTPDTFAGQFPKQITLPGATSLGMARNTLNADGATRNTCHLVDAKYSSGGDFYNLDLPFMFDPDTPPVEELRRYKYTMSLYPVVMGLEIRTNRSDTVAYWITALQAAGFAYNTDAFVYVYPSANYP